MIGCGQLLFVKFDALVCNYAQQCGAFKVDTIGDAYVVAAWLRGSEVEVGELPTADRVVVRS